MAPFASQDYTVGWICALPLEMAAAIAMLDDDHGNIRDQDSSDRNNYRLGCIRGHNVVIACLPAGVYGVAPAATVAAQMLSSFKSIKIGLMVGIGGGVPAEGRDIRLGDVVVSKPGMTSTGVIHYDLGKTVQEGQFKHIGSLNKPPQALLTAISSLEADHIVKGSKIPRLLSEMIAKHPDMEREFSYQGTQHDQLYEATYDHVSNDDTCGSCDAAKLKHRCARSQEVPVIHYGLIASGNQLMRHGATRDRLREQFDVLCFEMEAAGLADNFPYLAIRGICDYADSHKNKRWQKHAAAVAAAYAKELLDIIPASEVAETHIATKATGLGDSSDPRQSLSFFLTNDLYQKRNILLASLVPNKHFPSQDAFTGILVNEESDVSISVDEKFNWLIHMESSSFLKTMVAKLVGGANEHFQISTDECRLYLLRQPRALFKRLCAQDDVREWLEEGYFGKQNTYFVIGYRTFLNAQLVCQNSSKVVTSGERIYAICYRKVSFKFYRGVDSAFLCSDNRWKSSFKTRGKTRVGDQFIEAGIEDMDDQGDGTCETFVTEDGEAYISLLPGFAGDEGDSLEESAFMTPV